MKTLAQHHRGALPTVLSDQDSWTMTQKEIVNRGIHVQSEFNTVCAIEYLKSYNINSDVIEQVLSHIEVRS